MKFSPPFLLLATSATNTTPQYVSLTEHDALGHTRTATATLNSFNYEDEEGARVLYVDYTTDQLFCSAFGP
jgi:hypothetical protein